MECDIINKCPECISLSRLLNSVNVDGILYFIWWIFFNQQDPRFNSEIDNSTGYKTKSVLCVPISNYEGEIIGVAQIINKTDGSDSFTDRDIQVSFIF